MCGIAGWTSAPSQAPEASALDAMALALQHRGPDGAGHWLDAARGLALAHRRLAILDLSPASAQPMVDASGAVLCYNGELYNYRAVRAELERAGAIFATSGDVEVVLKALLVWGRKALERFAGMFALAYVAPGSSRVLLARDPLGIKPLLVAPVPGAVLFASELRALLASGRISRRIDTLALREFLEFGYAFDGRRAMLEGVEKVAPGEWVELEAGRIVGRGTYYAPPESDPADRDPASRQSDLLETLRETVREHLVADVPVGVLLSGGLDSSVIAAIAAETARVRTVSFGFARSATDERVHARAVAQAIGSDHTEFLIEPEHAVEELTQHSDILDDLIADGAVLSNRLAYRAARKLGLKVVLVGEGADELFGGYGIFAAAQAVRGPAWWRRFQLYRRYSGQRFGALFGEFSRCVGGVPSSRSDDWIQAARRFELTHQLPNQYVVKVDRASMAESVEARTPYLDRRVVAAAMRFPAGELGIGADGKRPLREAARRLGVLPEAIIARPKFGISLAAEWLDDEPALRALASDLLMRRDSLAGQLGLGRPVRAFLRDRKDVLPLPSPYGVLRHLVWRLLLLTLWSRRLEVVC